jgi:1-acyl-sn-glycerol-3-phosphate acyltransferase
MFLRSLLYNLVMLVTVLVYAVLMMFTVVLPFRRRYRLITAWPRFQIWLAKYLLKIDYRIEGREHLPSGAAIVMAKHQSAWETLALPSLLPTATFILKRELLWIPFFGWGLSLLKPIAIDRGAGQAAMDQVVAQGRARLDEGIWVVVFPEGTRVPPGQQRRYKRGGAVLAAQTGYPIVPVAHNAGHFWPRRGFIKKPGTVRVVIGPVISSKGRGADEILRDAERWIESKMREIESPAP